MGGSKWGEANGDILNRECPNFRYPLHFRYPLQRSMIEFPAGKLDHGETPLATGQRELREEAGYVATSWWRLGSIHSVVGYSNERMYHRMQPFSIDPARFEAKLVNLVEELGYSA